MYRVWNDSIYGCNAGGVAVSALVTNSSKTSLGGSGSDMVEDAFALAICPRICRSRVDWERVALYLFVLGCQADDK